MPLIRTIKAREGTRTYKSLPNPLAPIGTQMLDARPEAKRQLKEQQEIRLRKYQRSGVNSSLRNLSAEGSVVRTLATGGGKTEEAICIAKNYKQIIFISPTEMLSIQSAERFRKAGIPAIAVTKNDRWWKPGMDWPEGIQAVMCTEGTAHSRWIDFEPDLIIFDEAHHVYNPTYSIGSQINLAEYGKEFVDAYQRSRRWTQQARRVELNKVRKKYKVSQAASIALTARYLEVHIYGMTGTLWRLRDTEGFQEIWKATVIGPGLPDLAEQDHLVPLRTEIMSGLIIEKGIGEAKGAEDYTNAQLALYHRLNEARFTQEAIDWLLERSKFHGKKKVFKTICYAINQKHAVALAEAARERGVRVGLLLSSKDLVKSFDAQYEEQVETLNKFKNDELDMLVNVAIAIEGFDCPAAEAVLMTRVTKSLALYLQMVGRATRKSEGKEIGRVFDATNNSASFGSPMMKREWSLAPRGRKSTGEVPLTFCLNSQKCQVYVHPAMHKCPECKAMQGSKCTKCYSWSRGLEDDSKCHRCLVGEKYLAKIEEEKKQKEQIPEYVTWNHRNFQFSPSKQKDNAWDCVIDVDGTTVKMRISQKARGRDKWRGIWWDPSQVKYYEPEDWAELTVVGNQLADVRERLLETVKFAFGANSKVKLK